MLALDINWLSGTAWLARDPSSEAPDWPPQPDRIFSALVTSWGLGGEDFAERVALEWLETCNPPVLAITPNGFVRQAPTVFVPPNDKTDITALPDRRKRQPRRFAAMSLPDDDKSHLTLIWCEDGATHIAALNALAARTSYVGHSASLVRCRFNLNEAGSIADTKPAARAPYPGRLAELENLHKRHMAGDERARPRPSTFVGPEIPIASPSATVFSPEWVVFEHAGGERPDLLGAAIVCDTLRLALMEAWTKAHGGRAPGWISGHEANGEKALAAHLAIVPLANLGWEHADGKLMGLALILPRQVTQMWAGSDPQAFAARQQFARALGQLGEKPDKNPGIEQQENVLTLAAKGGDNQWSWRVRRSAVTPMQSLRPERYSKTSRCWTTATPILLDRHRKGKEQLVQSAEAIDIIAEACHRIGLPVPAQVRIAKHAAISGAPSAWPAGGSPSWQNWSRKAFFGRRDLCHATITFDEIVTGPVILGAARFLGLGLCLPKYDERRVSDER